MDADERQEGRAMSGKSILKELEKYGGKANVVRVIVSCVYIHFAHASFQEWRVTL